MLAKFWLGSLKGRGCSEELGLNGSFFYIDLRETGLEGVDWIHLAQDRDRWRTLVNTVMNFFHQRRGIS
jgi:hypothetical protein